MMFDKATSGTARRTLWGRRAGFDSAAALAALAFIVAVFAPAARAEPVTHIVEIKDFKFDPEFLEVEVGDVVIWRNLDIAPHTATQTGGDGWDSGLLRRNEEWSMIAVTAGEVDYLCTYHPSMKGRLRVLSAN
ncbi:MAG: hypothetical protein Tsb0010_01460 [Parvularculaceae bacterium]